LLLLETIKVEAGRAENLRYHQARFEKSQKALFNLQTHPSLSSLIAPPSDALFRCRILYDSEIRSIEYLPYTAKTVKTLKIVQSDIDYAYKYADRDSLNTLLQAEKSVDEIIIEKDGLLSDTTIANIAFYDGKNWFTPEIPLLEGTMRAKLLDEGFLKTAKIRREDLLHYTHVALMNAMIGFKILKQADIR